LGRAPCLPGSREPLASHGAERSAAASATTRPSSVSEYVLRPLDSSALISPSSASSCRVG
jgi:hypothetical protein